MVRIPNEQDRTKRCVRPASCSAARRDGQVRREQRGRQFSTQPAPLSAADEVADGAYYVEIDGQVYVDATGLFNRHWSNGPMIAWSSSVGRGAVHNRSRSGTTMSGSPPAASSERRSSAVVAVEDRRQTPSTFTPIA
jgi:hypothetical protein